MSVIERRLRTVREVLDDLLPSNSEDAIFRKESAEAFIRDLIAQESAPSGHAERALQIWQALSLERTEELLLDYRRRVQREEALWWARSINKQPIPIEEGNKHLVELGCEPLAQAPGAGDAAHPPVEGK